MSSAGAEPSQAEEALDRGTRVLGPVEAPPAAKGRAQPQRRPTSLGLAVLVFLVMFGAGAGGAALWTLSGAGWPDLDLGGLGSAPPASDPQAARQPAAASEADGESASEAEVAAAERAAEVEARRQQAEEEAALEEARRQAEAKRRAEAEAKRKAEQEARKRAEAEIAAQRRAQEEARRRVEAEAEKQAEAELRRKAEEQARRQAEAEALAKAETAAAAEAKRQAEAAAQRTTGAAAPGQQVSALPASRSSAAQPTTQSEMAGLFAGGSVYATTQLVPTRDDHWKFSADGSVEGNFSRSRRNPGLAPEFGSDHGRWWIADNRLCVQWQNWEEGKPHCYAISGTGREYVASGDGLLDGPFKLVK